MIPTEVKRPFDTEGTFRIDAPAFLKEVIESSGCRMYAPAWNIFKERLSDIVQRATELHDPVLDALMLRMRLYEVSPKNIVPFIRACEKAWEEGDESK